MDSRASFKQLDVYDSSALKAYLEENKIDAVLHCAGEIVVSESIENPSKYFTANVAGMNQVLKVLSEVGIQKIMFSSTASLYGITVLTILATEDTLLDPVNPYAETKLMGERMITGWPIATIGNMSFSVTLMLLGLKWMLQMVCV